MASFGRVTPADPGLYGTPGEVDVEVSTVRAIYDAFGRRDIEGMLDHVAEDCIIDLPGTSERAGRGGEPYRGPEGVRQYFEDAARVWSELTLHAEDIRAASEGVVVFGHVEGQREGEVLRRRVIWTWQIRAGKAVRVTANDLGSL
jgi:ketosteroid isomerase-like protein